MKFRTEIEPIYSNWKIGYDKRGLAIGSCFSENLGGWMRLTKFPMLVNPMGLVYNPVSVVNTLDIIANRRLFTEADLIRNRGKWFSYYHQGSFAGKDKEQVLRRINDSIIAAHDFLAEVDYLVITLGTAWVFEHNERRHVVSNCHKMSSDLFHRYRLEVDYIVEIFAKMMEHPMLKGKKLIFTVSPIRHLADSLAGNCISKATLRLAVERIRKMIPNTNYFPAFEILTDDLRDYRYYDTDMVHPSQAAREYVREKFKNAYFDGETLDLCSRIEKIHKAYAHRVFDPYSSDTSLFFRSALTQINHVLKMKPGLDFSDEVKYFTSYESV